MADNGGNGSPSSSSSPGKKSTFGFLTKRIGPVPVWVIIAAIAAGWYWYYHYGPGAARQQQAAQAQPAARGLQPGRQPVRVTVYDYDTPATHTGVHGPHGRHQPEPHRHDHDHDDHGAASQPPAEPGAAAAPGAAEDMTTRWRTAA